MATTKKTTKAKPAASRAKATATTAAKQEHVLKRQFRGDLMLGTLFAEMVGTFVLSAIVLATGGYIPVVGLTVLVLVIVASRLSGAHFNPAITLAMLATRQISAARAAGYIIAQCFGAMLGLVVVTQLITSGSANELTGALPQVFQIDKLVGDWRPFFGEVLGALVFAFGVAAAVIGKKAGTDAGFAVGGALMLGLILASLAGTPILNPAVAISVSAYQADNAWTIYVYALAPIIGAVAGAWLYKLLQWDVESGKQAS